MVKGIDFTGVGITMICHDGKGNILMHKRTDKCRDEYREIFREHEGSETHWIQFDFKVLVDPKDVRIGEPEKMSELGWFTFDTLPSPLHSAVQQTFDLRRKNF